MTEKPRAFKSLVLKNPKGDIVRGIRRNSEYFHGFGEMYFTQIKSGQIKGWKLHEAMHSNLFLAYGEVTFYLKSDWEAEVEIFELKKCSNTHLYIPANYWFAFEGSKVGDACIVNFASIIHDPTETRTMEL